MWFGPIEYMGFLGQICVLTSKIIAHKLPLETAGFKREFVLESQAIKSVSTLGVGLFIVWLSLPSRATFSKLPVAERCVGRGVGSQFAQRRIPTRLGWALSSGQKSDGK
jgi:hypothetical protein